MENETRDDPAEHVKKHFEAIETRLLQRIEQWERHIAQQIDQLRTDLYRALLLGFGGLAMYTIVINLLFD